jgi:hypothetical protein
MYQCLIKSKPMKKLVLVFCFIISVASTAILMSNPVAVDQCLGTTYIHAWVEVSEECLCDGTGIWVASQHCRVNEFAPGCTVITCLPI